MPRALFNLPQVLSSLFSQHLNLALLLPQLNLLLLDHVYQPACVREQLTFAAVLILLALPQEADFLQCCVVFLPDQLILIVTCVEFVSQFIDGPLQLRAVPDKVANEFVQHFLLVRWECGYHLLHLFHLQLFQLDLQMGLVPHSAYSTNWR